MLIGSVQNDVHIGSVTEMLCMQCNQPLASGCVVMIPYRDISKRVMQPQAPLLVCQSLFGCLVRLKQTGFVAAWAREGLQGGRALSGPPALHIQGVPRLSQRCTIPLCLDKIRWIIGELPGALWSAPSREFAQHTACLRYRRSVCTSARCRQSRLCTCEEAVTWWGPRGGSGKA